MSVPHTVIELRDARLRRGGTVVLDVPALAIAAGETLALIGPNGAGKSTLLLRLAGIERAAEGELVFHGAPVRGAKAAFAYRRRVAMSFQEPLLFDVSVLENAAAGLKLRGIPKAEVFRRAHESLERFHISHLAGRSARTLSGGEARRTSLARAFAIEPEILLLDEPFAALDPPTRAALIADLDSTLRSTRTTTVFATHDIDEARCLADRVAFLHEGRLRQIGPTAEVIHQPADAVVAAFVAAFVGPANTLRDRTP